MNRQQALSTPRKQQLQALTYCSDSERDGRHLPPRSALRLIQCPDHRVFQKNTECEGRKGYCNSTQKSNQSHTRNNDLLTEDLKFPTSSRCSGSARAPPCEEQQGDAAEDEKAIGMKKTETNCRRSSRLARFICAMVFAALLLAWWKQDPSNELHFVPT